MRYVEQELYAGIQTRLLAGAIESHYTDASHVKPATIREYNNDYEPTNDQQLPFNRPAVFIEFGEYELQDMGGYVKGPVPITLHVVQDMVNQSGNVNSTQDTKYQAKLKYPSLIQELLHQYRISNCILDVKKPKKDPDAKNLMVYLIEITARVRVPRRSSSLPAETPLSAFSYSNASQTIDEGNPITTITATTTGDVARFVVDINSTIISGLVLDPTSGQISGTPTAEGSFKVAAISQYGQVIGVVVVTIAFTGATTPVTSLTYSNDEQTIYEETGDGAFVPMFATTDPAGATGSYSSVDLPDGLSLNSSTSEITAETFGDIPAGENTFTVTFTGSGDYSGTADYEVTVTKRELWEPTDLASGLEAWWDFTEDGTVTLDTYEGASVFNQVNDLSGNNNHLTQSTGAFKPIVGSFNGKRVATHFGSSFMTFTPGSDISQPFTIFYGLVFPPQSGIAYLLGSELDLNNRRIYFDCSNFFYVHSWGVSGSVNITAEEINNAMNITGNVYQMEFDGASSSFKVDAGETLSTGTFNGGTNNIPSSNPTRLLQYGSGSTNGSGALLMIAGIVSGTISLDNEARILGCIAHKMGIQDKLPAAHPYKTLPPFKPLP